MNKKFTSLQSKTDWKRLETISDEEIDLTDIPELTPEQASLGKRQEGHPSQLHEVTVHYEDGSQQTFLLGPGMVIIDPDLRPYFPDTETVNRVLRTLLELVPHPPKPAG